MKKITVNTQPAYDIFIGEGCLSAAGKLIKPATRGRTCCVVTDSNVAPLYARETRQSLEAAGFSVLITELPAGEKNKTFAAVGDIL
ncbi:MAG: 3-dehydroquinate synthase, partial [Oscillospiraceae bacterium]|nr:3-dehydroquinate synthase [Oscillospiraceae bacterium]